jgi:hypothetical protein
MPRVRHLLVGLAAGAALTGALAVPSHASVDACPDPLPSRVALPHCLATQHFEVWYTSDTKDPAYVTFTQASDLAGLLESAYAAEMSYGFTPPKDDGDGKTDVYITTLSPGTLGEAVPDNPAGPTSSGFIAIDVGEIGAADELHVLAHELFHLVQFATWIPPHQTDHWLFEGSAEWIGAKVDGFHGSDVTGVGPSDIPLDCSETITASPDFQLCDPDPYVDGGYSRWPFFQYLAQRFGPTFFQDVLARGAAAGTATGALQAAIAARGSTLADVYSAWSAVQMDGGYGIPQLDAIPPKPYATVVTGAMSAPASLKADVNVDHLATRYVEFRRGDGGDHLCFQATLTVTVTIPDGVVSQPYFSWNGGAPVALSISGGTASAAVPWDTCNWPTGAGFLSLPNGTANVDSADFKVSTALDVTTNPASASTAPAPATIWGDPVAAPTADVPPSIELFGPELLTISPKARLIRLIVESSGPGALQATLGAAALGSRGLRAGNNDLRFAVPASLVTALRRAASTGARTLTLMPYSANGSVAGEAVTRRVAIARK